MSTSMGSPNTSLTSPAAETRRRRPTGKTATDGWHERIAQRFEWPLIAAAVLTIPVTIMQLLTATAVRDRERLGYRNCVNLWHRDQVRCVRARLGKQDAGSLIMRDKPLAYLIAAGLKSGLARSRRACTVLCVAAGVLLAVATTALASSGTAGSIADLQPLLPSGRVTPQIVGGVTAVQGQLPFMAFILHHDALGNPDFACSGTVVSTNVVLTAGHCAVDESTGAALDPSGYQVTTGAVDVADTVNRRVSGVSRVIVDPAYNRTAKIYDAALLVLSAPTTAPTIRLAGSVDQYLEQAGTAAAIAGWGDTYAGEPYLTDVLQWATTGVQSSTYCAQFSGPSFTFNPAVHLCAVDYPSDQSGACNGDSGGPLLAVDAAGRLVQIGVTSLGPTNCNTSTADYFTAARPLSSWANSWIAAVAPAPPPPPPPSPTAPPVTTSPPSAPSTPRLPRMTVSTGRSYARQTVAGVLTHAFKHQHNYNTSCTRKSAIQISCQFGFWSGQNDYWGTVTVHYLFGSNDSLEWTATYTMHWVNDQCYYDSGHQSRCRISTRRGNW
jgi:secreted trypsin-like serine protease